MSTFITVTWITMKIRCTSLMLVFCTYKLLYVWHSLRIWWQRSDTRAPGRLWSSRGLLATICFFFFLWAPVWAGTPHKCSFWVVKAIVFCLGFFWKRSWRQTKLSMVPLWTREKRYKVGVCEKQYCHHLQVSHRSSYILCVECSSCWWEKVGIVSSLRNVSARYCWIFLASYCSNVIGMVPKDPEDENDEAFIADPVQWYCLHGCWNHTRRYLEVYPALAEEWKPIECVLRPGELIFVPQMWV